MSEQTGQPETVAVDRVPAEHRPRPRGERRALILLVDDDPVMRDYVRRLLARQFDVIAAVDGGNGLRGFHDGRPDLVLANAARPGAAAAGLVRQIRADPASATAPIILLCEGAGDTTAADFDCGADDYLIVPFSQGELMARVSAQLALDRLRREAAERMQQQRRADQLEALNRDLQSEIAKRRHAEEAMQLQLQVLNNIPAVAWTVTPDGTCDFINRFYLEATGLSAEFCLAPVEAWKKAADDLPPFLSGLHPDHKRRAAEIFWGGIRSGTGWAFEAPFLHADNAYHWHFDRAVPLRNRAGEIVRFVGTCADIDELRVSQEALAASENRLRAIVDHSPSQIFLKDPEGRYLLVNREFERLYRLSERQVIGRTDEELLSPEDAAASRAADRQVLETRVALEFEALREGGDGPHWGIVQKFPLFDAAGNIFAIGGIVTDITERKRAEEAVRHAQAELARASRVTTVGQLAASVAHELNQPLSAIQINGNTCVHWLKTSPPQMARARVAAERILGNASRAILVIDRIRAMLQKTVPERTALDLNEILGDTLALVASELRGREVTVSTELQELPVSIVGDRVQIQQVMLNLIMNAIEAMGPVRERRRLLRISSCVEGAEGIRVAVQDSGSGFDPATADRAFDSFFTTKSGGMGLGLAICRSIIENHGGRIWASSAPSGGAVVQFTLPADDGL